MYFEPLPIPVALILISVVGCIVGALETGTLIGGLQFAGALLLFVIFLGAVTLTLSFLYYMLTGQL